jgi:hypothetical protein
LRSIIGGMLNEKVVLAFFFLKERNVPWNIWNKKKRKVRKRGMLYLETWIKFTFLIKQE